MTEQEQAAADPRVGDRWNRPAGGFSSWISNVDADAKTVDVGFSYQPGMSRVYTWTFDEFAAKSKGWTLAARGPAPATPERDPYTQPVVGDEWDQDNGHLNLSFKVDSIDDDCCYITFGDGKKGQWERSGWATFTKHRKLHRRGDDPAWRPATNTDVNVPWKVLTEKDSEKVLDAIENGEMRVDWPMLPVEQPAAGIKVGDRVKNRDGEKEGVVDEIEGGRIWVSYTAASGHIYRRYAFENEWQSFWTIIPPAAAPDDTEQPEPIEAIDRNPHTEPMVGDEWSQDGLEIRVTDVESHYVEITCYYQPGRAKCKRMTPEEFAAKSFLWRLSKPADLDPDDVGDEPPTPDIVTNANGARQSRLAYRCDLLPPKATLHVSEILRRGAEKYGDTNYLGISTADHINHALTHVLQYLAGDVSEDHLGNATARMLFALETKGKQ